MTPQSPCNCGCSDCKGECCDLECLVKPRFFCGQLLTDNDLSTLVDWVKDKSALARYRHGWGVVCGLQVHSSCGRGNESKLTISPGYAVDCCGNDIVVCAEDSFDLSAFCQSTPSPCDTWPPKEPAKQQQGTITFGGWTLNVSEVRAVDLFVFYNEDLTDPHTGLARGTCNSSEACEFTRTHESYRFCAVPVANPCDHGSAGLEWSETYRKGLDGLLKSVAGALKMNGNLTDVPNTLQALETWTDAHPLRDFCFVGDWITTMRTSQNDPPADWFAQMAFWIVQDWRNQYLHCDCFSCGPDSGVPLARVWLWRGKDRCGKDVCKVICVDPYPPFRRPIQTVCWPGEAGSINLSRFIWERLDTASVELARAGIMEITAQPFPSDDLASMQDQLLHESLFVQSMDQRQSKQLIAYYVLDNCGASRIVSFGLGDRGTAKPVDVGTLQPTSPELDLRQVDGIGDRIAERLNNAGIRNLMDLAAADPAKVAEALKDIPINPPTAARTQIFVNDAKAALDRLKNPK